MTYIPTCPRCAWMGARYADNLNALNAADRHIANTHPAMLARDKRVAPDRIGYEARLARVSYR